MSIPEQIRALEELAAMDARLKLLDEEISQERSALETLKKNLKKVEEKLQTLRANLLVTDKTRNELLIEVRSMNQQLDHSRDKLARARNERESNAAQRELEELRKLLRDREDELTRLNSVNEASHREIEGAEQESARMTAELEEREGDIRSRLALTEQTRDEKLSAREVAAKALPPNLYRRYEVVRSKRNGAIAQTTDGTCKACFMALPPQLFHRLRREPMLEQCPSCNRIIYFVPPVAPEP